MSKSKRETFEDIILEILQNNPKVQIPFNVMQNILRVNGKKDNQRLKSAINSLFDRNLIVKRKGGALQLAAGNEGGNKNVVTGKMDVSRRGTGYLITDTFDADDRLNSSHIATCNVHD